jgi:hypothetical protein
MRPELDFVSVAEVKSHGSVEKGSDTIINWQGQALPRLGRDLPGFATAISFLALDPRSC